MSASPAASGESGDVLIGRTLAGKYRLLERLRAGAMGSIYRAHHVTLEKAVCIKIMHAELAKEAQFAERFHREARAASRFDHPNSIMILDHGEEDGLLYIAMELIDGRDLSDIIEEAAHARGGVPHAFPPRRVVDLLTQTLAAVGAAHDVGILHRDLKPENIMVSPTWEDDGAGERVKVCDFGIAHIDDLPAESGRRLTMKGYLLGTPEYMSPEQARADVVDARSEVYSAGVILYLLLTGRLPFEDESPIAVAIMQINEAVKKPSELVPAVHRGLEKVCLRALEKDPAKRFATAREMRAALREAIGDPSSTRMLPAFSLPTPLATPAEALPEPLIPLRSRTSLTGVVAASVAPMRRAPTRAFGVGLGFGAVAAVIAFAAVSASAIGLRQTKPITHVSASLVGAPDTAVVAPDPVARAHHAPIEAAPAPSLAHAVGPVTRADVPFVYRAR